jgi:hypothetical protein
MVPEDLLVASDLDRHGLEADSQLIQLSGQAGEREGFLSPVTMLLHQGSQFGPPVESRPAHAGASSHVIEGDRVVGGREFATGLLDATNEVSGLRHGLGS